jgi:septum site-determining protein MinD
MTENNVAKKKTGRSIVVTSGKGGVGKTTATASIGAALALKGKRTLVIDADIGLRNLDVILGLENRIVFNLVDVAKKVCKPAQALIRSKKTANLYLLPASQTDDKDVVQEAEVKAVVEQYKREFDYVLIDSPAGIEQGFKNAVAGADEAIVVTTPEVSAIRDADRVVGLLTAREIEARMLINRVDFDLVRRGDMLSIQDVQEILCLELIGVVERDDSIIVAANTGEPVVFNKKSVAGTAFIQIAERIMGEKVPIHIKSNSFWGRFGRTVSVS